MRLRSLRHSCRAPEACPLSVRGQRTVRKKSTPPGCTVPVLFAKVCAFSWARIKQPVRSKGNRFAAKPLAETVSASFGTVAGESAQRTQSFLKFLQACLARDQLHAVPEHHQGLAAEERAEFLDPVQVDQSGTMNPGETCRTQALLHLSQRQAQQM